MAATHKKDLLEIAGKEYGKLAALLDQVEAALACEKDADDTSIKDVVGHRAHWIALFLGWYADGRAGREVCFPAKGYKWNELKRYNADLRRWQSDLDWPAACKLLAENHAKLTAFIEGLSQDALYGGPMEGAKNAWTTGRWAEAAGPSHYRSASKYIRKRLKELRG